jgi:hypothetical protein
MMKRILGFWVILGLMMGLTLVGLGQFRDVSQEPGFRAEDVREFAAQLQDLIERHDAAFDEVANELSEANCGLERFVLRRLVVSARGRINSFGAIETLRGYNGVWYFQYASVWETYLAYGRLRESERVEWVEPDTPLQLGIRNEELGIASEILCDNEIYSLGRTYNSWGAGVVGIDIANQFLLDNIGPDKLEPRVVIAVIDSGIHAGHPIFEGRLVAGWNFQNGNSNVGEVVGQDAYGHGTHVAGIIADLTLPNVMIMPIRALYRGATSATIVSAIDYVTARAVEHNIVAINMSLGSTYRIADSTNYERAINRARDRGILSVAAAGNDARDVRNTLPARLTNTIAVSSVSRVLDSWNRPILDGNGNYTVQFSSFSNFGARIDIAAPGGNILSAAVTGNGTRLDSGTSMAVPHVSAAIAIIASNPHLNYSISEIEGVLFSNANKVGGFTGRSQQLGHGVLDISKIFCTSVLPPINIEDYVEISVSINIKVGTVAIEGGRQFDFEREDYIAFFVPEDSTVVIIITLPDQFRESDENYSSYYLVRVKVNGEVQFEDGGKSTTLVRITIEEISAETSIEIEIAGSRSSPPNNVGFFEILLGIIIDIFYAILDFFLSLFGL